MCDASRIRFAIHALSVGAGTLALSPIPGRVGAYARDLETVLAWGPAAVLTMTTRAEMEKRGALTLGADLTAAGIAWLHMPVGDRGVPAPDEAALWPEISARLRRHLAEGARILIHCHGGCGRSGMTALRLMVEMGENGPDALHRLRMVRECAVESQAQLDWGFAGAI